MVNQKGIKERASEALKSVNKARRFVTPKKGQEPCAVYQELQKAKNQLVSLIKLLCLTFLLFSGVAYSETIDDLYDPNHDHYDYEVTEHGLTYTVKPDPLHEGEYITEDRYGHRTGFLKKDPLHPDRFIVQDEYGHYKRTLRPDPLHKDRFVITNDKPLLKRGDRTKIIRKGRE